MNKDLTYQSAHIATKKYYMPDIYSKAIVSMNFSDIFITHIGHTSKNPHHFWSTDFRADFCLQYVNSGTGEFFANNSLYKLNKGDLFLVPQQEKHYYRSNRDNPYDLYFIHINGRGARNFLNFIQLSDKMPITSVRSDRLPALFEEIITLSKDYKDLDELLLLSKTYAILSEIASSTIKKDTPPRQKTREEKIVNTTVTYIEEHFNEKILLDDIAKIIHINKNYLVTIFHKSTGYSPIDYLINYRLNYAKTLLWCDYTITEISFMCGFSDVYTFSKCFKQKVGISPLSYKKDLLQQQKMNKKTP